MNNLIVLVIILWGMTSCSQKILVSSFSLDDINQSRSQALKAEYKETKQWIYQVLRKKSRQILHALFLKAKKEGVALNDWGSIRIIDNYEGDYRQHDGVLWEEDTYYLYRYDFDLRRITKWEVIRKDQNYPINPDIHLSVIKFWTSFTTSTGYAIPAPTGRSHTGYYIYTRIDNSEDSKNVESYARRQW